MSTPIRTATALTLVSTLGLAACGGGGSSDVVEQPQAAQAAAETTLSLFAYAVPKVAFDRLIPAFQQTPAGTGVEFQQSYGASGDQSRKVAAGAQADIVSFSVEPDVTRLVDAGLIEAEWNADERRGIPFVWFGTESGHEVKDIRSGQQVAADPAAWSPPEQDLRPQLIVTEELS